MAGRSAAGRATARSTDRRLPQESTRSGSSMRRGEELKRVDSGSDRLERYTDDGVALSRLPECHMQPRFLQDAELANQHATTPDPPPLFRSLKPWLTLHLVSGGCSANCCLVVGQSG
jgi:hypothetical protein